MKHTDCHFPIINYKKTDSYFKWGHQHGAQFSEQIKELAAIRKKLMLAKNPALEKNLSPLADEQFEITRNFAPHLADELRGIAEGSGLTLEEIVILNNYTDFRDIQLPEEGCSTIHVQRGENSHAGQTWDMHASAKNYLCLIHVPKNEHSEESIILTLVGCVGLMGVNTNNCLIGVNNINTKNATSGVIWPVLVRKVLEGNNFLQMRDILHSAPVTSGHNYLLSSPEQGEHWEITPTQKENVGSLTRGENGATFHTNHCIGPKISLLEDKSSASSTTHNRFRILTEKAPGVEIFEELIDLLTDHDEYPKSICSHFETGGQDPSTTCGGGAINHQSGKLQFWRGCETHDSNFKKYIFEKIKENDSYTFKLSH